MTNSVFPITFRRLRRSPRFATAVVVCVALGMAATGTMTALIRATLFRPLPFPDADRLVRVWLAEPGVESRFSLSWLDLTDLLEHDDSFEAVEATARARIIVLGPEGGRRLEAEAVTAGYFDLLGITPVRGRLFSKAEHAAGGDGVVLLGHAAWGSQFGFDEDVIGTTLRADDGSVYTIIGVLPPYFTGSVEDDSGELELWLPIRDYLSSERMQRRDVGGIWVVAKLAIGVSEDQAEQSLAGLTAHLARTYPDTHRGRGFAVERMGENWRDGLRSGAWTFLGGAIALLLVAVLDVAALLLARGLDRRHQVAIQTALGADRRRLVAPILAETLLLIGFGGLLGAAASGPLLRLLLAQPALDIPLYVTPTMDLSALGVSLAILAVCGLAAAIAPCLLAARIAPTEVLRAGVSSAGRREQRLWTGLVLAEVALTVGLLVVSGVLLRSWQAQLEQGLGYRTDDVLRIALFVNPEDAREPDELRRIHNRIRETVTVTPGVESLGMLWPTLPLRQPAEVVVRFSGKVPRFQEEGLRAASFAADPQLFQTLGIPVVAGRPFTAADEPGSPPVALVSASVAEQMGGLEAALGNEVEIGGDRLLVVGVVGDIRSRGPRSDDSHRFEIYRPLAQDPRALVSLYITVATDSARGEVATDPLALVEPLSRRLAQIAPWSALDWVGTVESYRHRIYLQEPEFLAGLVTIFSATATTLSAIGLFALLSAAVTRSRPELGIRLALGASPARLAGRVLGRSLLLVTVAVGIGGALGAAGVRLVESSVWGVTTRDPASFAAAALVIIAMGAVAATIPAVRAARIDPASSLKL